MSGTIKRVFLNVSMSNRFDGLQKIAKEAGIKVHDMDSDSYLVFVNIGRDKIAMLVGPQVEGSGQVMAYTRLGGGRKVDLRIIAEIPKAFDGRELNYNKALLLAVEKALLRKSKTIEMV